MTRYFPKMKMLIICAGTHDWLNRVTAPQPIQEAELQAVIEVTVDGMVNQVECAPAVPNISIVIVAPPRTLPREINAYHGILGIHGGAAAHEGRSWPSKVRQRDST